MRSRAAVFTEPGQPLAEALRRGEVAGRSIIVF